MERRQKLMYSNQGRLTQASLLSGKQVRRLRIDRRLVSAGFGRNEHDKSQARGCFLNLRTGKLLWLPLATKNRPGRGVSARAKPQPPAAPAHGQYLEIPALSHAELHKLLCAFLASEWTDDAELRSFAALAYDGSIEHWSKRVPERALRAFERFKSIFLTEFAEGFLKDQGIHAEWS